MKTRPRRERVDLLSGGVKRYNRLNLLSEPRTLAGWLAGCPRELRHIHLLPENSLNPTRQGSAEPPRIMYSGFLTGQRAEMKSTFAHFPETRPPPLLCLQSRTIPKAPLIELGEYYSSTQRLVYRCAYTNTSFSLFPIQTRETWCEMGICQHRVNAKTD